MPSLAPLRDGVAERLTLTQVATALVFAAALHQFLGASLPQVVLATATTAFVAFGDIVGDAYDIRESVTHGWNGALAFVGAGLLYAIGDDPPLWFLGVFGSIGAWFLADAVQTARHEGVTERERDGRAVYRDYVARRVHETLDERPRTRRELRDALDADAEAVDAAVARLRERRVVTEVGSELRLDESDESTVRRLASRLAGFARRIARPVTLEFWNENDDETEVGPIEAPDEVRSVDAPDAPDEPDRAPDSGEDATADRGVAGSETNADRERELSRN